MTDVPSAQTVILVAASAIALTALIAACLIMLRRTTRRCRAWHQPVEVCPDPDYPDDWSAHLDQLDLTLGAIERETWTDADWRRLLTCPHPRQEGFVDQRRANESFPSAEAYQCPCGLWHVHVPVSRTWRFLHLGRRP